MPRNDKKAFNGTYPELEIRDGELVLIGLHIGDSYVEHGDVYDRLDMSADAIKEREVNAFLDNFWDSNYNALEEYASEMGLYNDIGIDYGDDYKHELRTGEVA
ncbi:hypothetical protein [Kangiella sp.]|uniref:hypothetical protein n=1 Tax=Kangiella sp. TaxID=1920245 RepID=UPI003A93DBEF